MPKAKARRLELCVEAKLYDEEGRFVQGADIELATVTLPRGREGWLLGEVSRKIKAALVRGAPE